MSRNLILSGVAAFCFASAASAQTTNFGSDNDGLGGFNADFAGGGTPAPAWSVETSGVRFTNNPNDDSGQVNSSLLKAFSLNRADGTSHTFTGVVDWIDTYAADNNRLGLQLFSDSDDIAGLDTGLNLQVNLHRNNLYMRTGGVNGDDIAAEGLTIDPVDLIGETLIFTATLDFDGPNIIVEFTLSAPNLSYTQTMVGEVVAEDHAGEHFGFGTRGRVRNVDVRVDPYIYEARSFSYEPPVAPSVQLPLIADFGSVRLVNIRDDISQGQFEIGVAEEGGLPFVDEEITITSLPSQLAGKVALRTANSQATWLLEESGTYLAFEVDRDTTIYVINDSSSEPSWLTSTFSSTGMTVDTTAGTFDVWERAVTARELVVLPGKGGELTDSNYWLVLDETPAAITAGPENLFMMLPPDDWSVRDFYLGASSEPSAGFHTSSILSQVTNFSPESGFRMTSLVRVPRLQQEGDNSIGFLLLGGSEAGIRAEWLPRASAGDSVLRFVDTSNGNTLAQQPWTGLAPTSVDNDVGISEGGTESVFSAGSLAFVEGAGALFFSEDFEAGETEWTTGANEPAVDQWEIGQPASGPDSAFSGDNVAATNLSGNYATGGLDDTVAWVRSPVIDLRNAGGATLRFHEYLDVDDFEMWHRAIVRAVNPETGAVTELETYNDKILQWTEREVDLSSVSGSQIILEFALYTDDIETDVSAGWYIDAVEVTGTRNAIVSLPENLTLDGTLNGIRTELAGVSDSTDAHLQFTVLDRGVSGNDGVTVYVAWDVRASGMEPDWLTQNFDRTDHSVGVAGDGGFHRLWAREYSDGAQVTLGGASAAGPGAAGLPSGTRNYFVLLGDARPGLETFYTMEATGAWNGGEGTLTFTLTDSNGVTDSVQTLVSGELADRNEFGLAVLHPDAAEAVEHAPLWEVSSLEMESLGVSDLLTFAQWQNSLFTADQINAGLSDPGAAPAGDGVANIIKYALDLAPLEPANPADLPKLESGADEPLILVYRERTDIDRNEIEYRPEVSEDLGGGVWNSDSGSITELLREPIGQNLEEVTVRGELPDGADRGFMRLNIIQQN